MSTFPTYRGKLPSSLNPFNPLHYLWLAYWIYFRPTALKSYLYETNPEFYRAGLGINIFSPLRFPAYRNLYLMVPGAILSLSVVARLVFVLITSWISRTPIDWANISQGAPWGIAWGIGVGVAYSFIASLAFGVAGSIGGGIATGVAVSLTAGVRFGMEVGIAVGIAGGVAVAVAFGVAGGIALGASFGAAFGAAVGLGVAIALDIRVGAAISFAGIVGALGMIFYPIDFLLAWKSILLGHRHPVEQDELVVLPLPGTQKYLLQQLKQPALAGLGIIAEVARNPFQRWAVHQALQAYLHNRDRSTHLHFLYNLLVYPKLDEYVFAPLNQTDWEILPTTRKLLLGEISNKWVDCNTEWAGKLAERLVWFLTKRWRDRPETPLTKFAGILYELLDEKTVNAEKFKLSKYESIYSSLRDYSGGEEIAQSFAALAKFLDYADLSELPAAIDESQQLNQVRGDYTNSTSIRPTVLNTIARLAEVGAEVANYQAATSKINKQAALLRATDDLDALDKYVLTEVAVPEQTILRRIIRQWRGLVSEVGGTIGRVEVSHHIVNPYIAGNPVKDPLFVGRKDILKSLEELWGKPGQCDSAVLYGHRRMGKSSILQRLSSIDFGTPTKVVDFNMQRVGKVDSSGQLLFYLALAIYDSWGEGAKTDLVEPKPEDFSQDPYIAFDRFLKRLDRVRDGHRFIITVDEFEYIEQQIEDGRIDPFLIGSWRGTFQTYPWFIMAFAGLHNLEEMRRDYWNPLYGSVTAVRVSFLSDAEATKLITQPTDDFPLDYDLGAVEKIIQLTHGQPYLVQLICDNLVKRFTSEIREGSKSDRRFTIENVDAVINSREFYEGNGSAYFDGVWGQARNSKPGGQLEILKVLAASSLSLTDLANQTNLSLDIVRAALKTLQNHDVIEESNGNYSYTVELMRRWVQERRD